MRIILGEARRWISLSLLLVLAGNGCVAADPAFREASAAKENGMANWFEIETLRAAEGRLYDEALRRGLSGPLSTDRGKLEELAQSPDWQTAATAKLLLGWMDHGAEYRQLLAMLDAENVQAAGRTAAGLDPILMKYRRLAATQYGPSILPLCWEVVLKHTKEWPAWKVVAFFRMMEVLPHPESLEPLLWFLETTRNDLLAHSAARALARLPRELVEPRLAELSARGAQIRARAEDVSTEIQDLVTNPPQ